MSAPRVGLLVLAVSIAQVYSECCTGTSDSQFCTVFSMLSPVEQAEVQSYIGVNCDGDVDEAVKQMEKRKPNFIRFGRSVGGPLEFGKKGSDPNFLRFGRSQPNFLRFGKSAHNGDPNFLRFGRSAEPNFLRFGRSAEPNFLRFGKAAADPNFLRFGKRSAEPNFLRFGRNLALEQQKDDEFDRESRKPNFLRFGRK